MKKDTNINELSPENIEQQKKARRRKKSRKKVMRVIDMVFGFILATGIMFGLGGLALEYVLVKGPSPALSETFIMTMIETRRFDFISNIFLTQEEVDAIKDKNEKKSDSEFNSSLINLNDENKNPESEEVTEKPEYPVDEDGDGYILEEVKRKNFMGYMLTVMDPNRVFVGRPDFYGGNGMHLSAMVEKYGAIGGINGGGFADDGGAGLGGYPKGLTIVDGECFNDGYGRDCFAGFDEEGILHIGYYNLQDVQDVHIRDGVSFDGPILLLNGEPQYTPVSGVNPRTAIGQRADGAVLMLVIDGRQAHSVGCSYKDLMEIMLDYGAVNAMNLDGGSSTTMYLNGEYVNSCSAGTGDSRPLPTSFLFK